MKIKAFVRAVVYILVLSVFAVSAGCKSNVTYTSEYYYEDQSIPQSSFSDTVNDDGGSDISSGNHHQALRLIMVAVRLIK